MLLTEEILKYAVMGGCILGGGGGGSMDAGLRAGKAALMYNPPQLINIGDIDGDALIVTASAVGAPSAVNAQAAPKDYVRAFQLLEAQIGQKIDGIITNENGGTATINGWVQSAVLDIPLIDAPCNGRAHPTGTMGSIGLNNVYGFISHQTAVGGSGDRHIEIYVKGSLSTSAGMVRKAADAAGGLVAVARNPVAASYVKKHAAVGGVSHAIDTGRAFYEGMKPGAGKPIESAVRFLNGKIIAEGAVDECRLETINAFDVGFVKTGDLEITFWNEYMTLERGGERIATFPDLIMTFDTATGFPVTTAELKSGQDITVIVVPRDSLRLCTGMYDEKLLKEIEPVINKVIV